MARRKRSYGKNKPVIGTFVNNTLANKEKKKREAKKQREQQARRQSRERELNRARNAREAEREQIRVEREQEKEKRKREKEREMELKRQEKFQKYMNRVKLELEKSQLYPHDQVAIRISENALEAGVTLAQIKSLLITDNLYDISGECAMCIIMDLECVKENWEIFSHLLSEIEDGDDTVANEIFVYISEYRPQKDVFSQNEFKNLEKNLSDHLNLLKAKFERSEQRKRHAKKISDKKLMFTHELEEYLDIIEQKDWSVEEAESSDEYNSRVENLQNYVKEVESKIKPFRLN